MKIILWIGNEPNQKALANKIHSRFTISAIVTETRLHKKKLTFFLIFEKIIEKLFLASIGQSWWRMLKIYDKKYKNYPNIDILNVENINSDAAYYFTIKYNPDLILVSGTRLLKEKMLSLKPSIGILNLHTGLSPYVKGGPNCTNWCIANNAFHLIGNTIMWIDEGIDTGNILTTECTVLNGDENLNDLHIKVMEHAHDLYLNAIEFIKSGYVQNVKQSEITTGNTYFTKQWTLKQKINLIKNMSNYKTVFKNNYINNNRKDIITVKLNYITTT